MSFRESIERLAASNAAGNASGIVSPIVAPTPEKSSKLRRFVADPAITGLKSAVGLVQGGVGIADLFTGGRVGKAIEDNTPVQLKQTQDELNTWYSPELKQAKQNVADAEGFFGTLGALKDNPAVPIHTVGESIFPMLGGGLISRGAVKGATAVAPRLFGATGEAAALTTGQIANRGAAAVTAGGFGEGTIAAGQMATEMRGENEDRLLSPRQALAAGAGGLGTALVSMASGGVARSKGIADIETMLAQGGFNKIAKSTPVQALQGMAVEGAEETLQSGWETAAQNFGMERDLGEGVPEAMAQGLVAGGFMGGGVSGVNALVAKDQPTVATSRDQLDSLISELSTTQPPAGGAGLAEQFLAGEIDYNLQPSGAVYNPEALPAEVRSTEQQLALGLEAAPVNPEVLPAASAAAPQYQTSEGLQGLLERRRAAAEAAEAAQAPEQLGLFGAPAQGRTSAAAGQSPAPTVSTPETPAQSAVAGIEAQIQVQAPAGSPLETAVQQGEAFTPVNDGYGFTQRADGSYDIYEIETGEAVTRDVASAEAATMYSQGWEDTYGQIRRDRQVGAAAQQGWEPDTSIYDSEPTPATPAPQAPVSIPATWQDGEAWLSEPERQMVARAQNEKGNDGWDSLANQVVAEALTKEGTEYSSEDPYVQREVLRRIGATPEALPLAWMSDGGALTADNITRVAEVQTAIGDAGFDDIITEVITEGVDAGVMLSVDDPAVIREALRRYEADNTAQDTAFQMRYRPMMERANNPLLTDAAYETLTDLIAEHQAVEKTGTPARGEVNMSLGRRTYDVLAGMPDALQGQPLVQALAELTGTLDPLRSASNAPLVDIINNGTALETLGWLAENSPNAFIMDTASALRNYFSSNGRVAPTLRMVRAIGTRGERGSYNARSEEIRLSMQTGTVQTILHELAHAATVSELRSNTRLRNKVKELTAHVINSHTGQNLSAYYGLSFMRNGQLTPGNVARGQITDSMTYEFIAEAMTNRSFQELLQATPSRTNRAGTVWTQLLEAISRALGISSNTGITALHDALSLSASAMRMTGANAPLSVPNSTQAAANNLAAMQALATSAADPRAFVGAIYGGASRSGLSSMDYFDSIYTGSITDRITSLGSWLGNADALERVTAIRDSGVSSLQEFFEAYNAEFIQNRTAEQQRTAEARARAQAMLAPGDPASEPLEPGVETARLNNLRSMLRDMRRNYTGAGLAAMDNAIRTVWQAITPRATFRWPTTTSTTVRGILADINAGLAADPRYNGMQLVMSVRLRGGQMVDGSTLDDLSGVPHDGSESLNIQLRHADGLIEPILSTGPGTPSSPGHTTALQANRRGGDIGQYRQYGQLGYHLIQMFAQNLPGDSTFTSSNMYTVNQQRRAETVLSHILRHDLVELRNINIRYGGGNESIIGAGGYGEANTYVTTRAAGEALGGVLLDAVYPQLVRFAFDFTSNTIVERATGNVVAPIEITSVIRSRNPGSPNRTRTAYLTGAVPQHTGRPDYRTDAISNTTVRRSIIMMSLFERLSASSDPAATAAEIVGEINQYQGSFDELLYQEADRISTEIRNLTPEETAFFASEAMQTELRAAVPSAVVIGNTMRVAAQDLQALTAFLDSKTTPAAPPSLRDGTFAVRFARATPVQIEIEANGRSDAGKEPRTVFATSREEIGIPAQKTFAERVVIPGYFKDILSGKTGLRTAVQQLGVPITAQEAQALRDAGLGGRVKDTSAGSEVAPVEFKYPHRFTPVFSDSLGAYAMAGVPAALNLNEMLPAELRARLGDAFAQSDTSPFFQRMDAPAPATPAQVTKLAKQLAPLIKKLAGIVPVRIVASAAEVDGLAPGSPDFKAVYVGGTVYLNAPNIANRAEAESLILDHELRHHGLRSLMGEAKLKTILQQVWYNKNNAVKDFAKIWGINTSDQQGRLEAAEEYIVSLAKEAKRHPALDKVISAIRDALRTLGFTLQLSHAELRALVARAGKIQDLTAAEKTAPGVTMFARQAPSQRVATAKAEINIVGKALMTAAKNLGRTALHWLAPIDRLVDLVVGDPMFQPLAPTLRSLRGLYQRMQSGQDELLSEGKRLWDKAQAASPSHESRAQLNRVLELGTLWGIFPDRPVGRQPWNSAAWVSEGMQEKTGLTLSGAVAELNGEWAAMSDAQKGAYNEIINHMTSTRGRLQQAMKDFIIKTTAAGVERDQRVAEVDAKFASIKGPYAPLSRFGDHVVHVFEGEERTARFHFESEAEADYFRSQMAAEGLRTNYELMSSVERTAAQGIPTAFIAGLTQSLQESGLEGAELAGVLADMTKLWVSLSPESSALRHTLRRKGIKGYSDDMLRSFMSYTQRNARSIAFLANGADIRQAFLTMDGTINMLSEEGNDTAQLAELRRLVDQLKKHDKMVREEKISPLVKQLSKLPFLWYLASPSIFVVQSTQPFMISLPYLAARFGFGSALGQVMHHYKKQFAGDYANNQIDRHLGTAETILRMQGELARVPMGSPEYNQLTAGLRTLLDGLGVDEKLRLGMKLAAMRGAIDITMSHEALEVIMGDADSRVGKSSQWVMEKAAFFMKTSEMASRKAVFAAAYELEMSKSGDFLKATEVGVKTVQDTLFDYSKSNRAAILTGNAGRLFGQFRVYQLHAMFKLVTLGRDAYLKKTDVFARMAMETNQVGSYQITDGQLVHVTMKPEATPEQEAAFRAEIETLLQDQRTARKELGFWVAGTLALSGVAGMPGVSTVFGALSLLGLLGGGDDDPLTAEDEFNQMMRQMPGGTTAMKGLPALLGVDVSRRIGMGGIFDLFAGDPPANIKGASLAAYYALKATGPIGGVATDLAKGRQAYIEGDWAHALTLSAPKAVKDMAKAYQMSLGDGYRTGSGKMLLPSESFSVYDTALAMVGLNPIELSLAQSDNAMVQTVNTRIADRKRLLLGKLTDAVASNDVEGVEQAGAAIAEFNKNMPMFAFKGSDLTRGLSTHFKKGLGLMDKNETKVRTFIEQS